MWQRQVHEAWRQGRRTVGHMWTHAVKFAGQLDHAVGVGKRLVGALHPAIQDMGGSQLSGSIMQGIGHYERGRDQVIGQHNKVEAQLSHLRRAVPEIDM